MRAFRPLARAALGAVGYLVSTLLTASSAIACGVALPSHHQEFNSHPQQLSKNDWVDVTRQCKG